MALLLLCFDFSVVYIDLWDNFSRAVAYELFGEVAVLMLHDHNSQC